MVEIVAFLYLMIPPLLFAIGWLKPVYAVLVAGLLVIAGAYSVREMFQQRKQNPMEKSSLGKIAVILLILFAWVLYSGVGGFVWQNPWDHRFRNAVFMDLVNRPWPVVQDDAALCYYLGFWLPSAVVGKAFGLEIGYAFQVVWAYIGVVLAAFMMFKFLGKVRIRTVLLLIFFSGLDVVAYLVRGLFIDHSGLGELLTALLAGPHIELMCSCFNSSCNTTLLFWLYNQIVPFWVGFMLLLLRHQKRSRSVVVVFAMLMLYSPFPCVALGPVLAYMLLRDVSITRAKDIWTVIKQRFGIETLCVIPFVGVVGAYYMSNSAAGNTKLLEWRPLVIASFIIYIVIEYGLYLSVLGKETRKDPILRILMIVTFVCSFITMGESADFAWRTCIPLSFYIMLLVAQKINSPATLSRGAKAFLCVLLCIGIVTPATEMIRTFRGEMSVLAGETRARNDTLGSVFLVEENQCYQNFIGDTWHFFYSDLCRK